MTEGEFWVLSLQQFVALLDRLNTEQQVLDRRTATVAWAIHNCSLAKRADGQPWAVTDFMPGRPEREQTPEEMIAVMKMVRG